MCDVSLVATSLASWSRGKSVFLFVRWLLLLLLRVVVVVAVLRCVLFWFCSLPPPAMAHACEWRAAVAVADFLYCCSRQQKKNRLLELQSNQFIYYQIIVANNCRCLRSFDWRSVGAFRVCGTRNFVCVDSVNDF